ncbi:MAG: DUF5996 family protein [Chloroflexota bacterium]|nr:DUF5996 family protein [Chloroflexota bacterium]MDE2951327.1 DUF5996 family protein [Chloroflexota bacterium]
MADLPTLENWESTRDGLHQVALALSAIKVSCVEPQLNSLQYSLGVTPGGLTTSRLNVGGELRFDIADLRLVYSRDERKDFEIDLAGYDQKSLIDDVVSSFASLGIEINPPRTHIRPDQRFEIEPSLAADYLTVLDAAYAALARFRAGLGGCLSPLVLWAHHFDLGFLCFPGTSMDERKDPQLAFGFAPCSPGLDRPYVYAYGWSPKAGYLQLPVSAPARAESDSYTGLYAGYDDLDRGSRFGSQVERILLDYYTLAKAKL